MPDKTKIKVIKKSELKKSEKIVNKDKKTHQVAPREIVSTVSNWVTEFRERRGNETKQAFEKLFGSQPKPSEV